MFTQPSKKFVEAFMENVHKDAPPAWHLRPIKQGEADLSSCILVQDFPDEEGLLETAYEDFTCFLKVCGIWHTFNRVCSHCTAPSKEEIPVYTIRTAYKETVCFEAYEIEVGEQACTLYAQDTEGIRRGLIWLEDEMSRREGPYLSLGRTERRPYVKTRISRNFFSPTSHEEGEEELATAEDYYPEAYLNRLAHDGINGLWIFVHFKTLLPSKIVPEYGRESERLIEKLRRTVAKCRRYGIKIYALGVEPASTHLNPALWKHPEMHGSDFWGGSAKAVCISTEAGRAYIEECGRTLFTLVPDLAGVINISVGEAVAGCGSVATKEEMSCPHCKAAGLTKPLALAAYEEALLKGMRKAKPSAELISWTYAHRGWSPEMRTVYLKHRSKDVVLMENFEDAGEVEQKGKPHLAMDYFLSYSGPGEIFKEAAEASMNRQTPLYAKLQVCNSHEIASVPYVPVPGKLYDKFKYMYEHGIEGAVYCWYFGNYPSLMNKAASELAFSDFTDTKDVFLKKLAGIYWGREAEKATLAWKLFEEGYSLFPVNVAFTWFGPMTDGIVWPLHLEPVDLPVSSNWTLDDPVGTDRFGEFLALGHTPEDAVDLCKRMYENMQAGLKVLAEADTADSYVREEQLSVAEALAILMESGTNIMRFYMLREQLAYAKTDQNQTVCENMEIHTGKKAHEIRNETNREKNYEPCNEVNTENLHAAQSRNISLKILETMGAIAAREAELTRRMLALCEQDSRLGYHSEAGGYKFFPEKLSWRLTKLAELSKEFERVEKRIRTNQLPLPFYYGQDEKQPTYQITAEGLEDAAWSYFETEKALKGSAEEMAPGNKTDISADVGEVKSSSVIEERASDCLQDGVPALRIAETLDAYLLQFANIAGPVEIRAEFNIGRPYAPVLITPQGEVQIMESTYYFMHHSLLEGACAKWKTKEQDGMLILKLKKADFGLRQGRPFRMSIRCGDALWKQSERGYSRLIWGMIKPDSQVFILPYRKFFIDTCPLEC